MGEGTRYATEHQNAAKFIEQINYQEIEDGEVNKQRLFHRRKPIEISFDIYELKSLSISLS